LTEITPGRLLEFLERLVCQPDKLGMRLLERVGAERLEGVLEIGNRAVLRQAISFSAAVCRASAAAALAFVALSCPRASLSSVSRVASCCRSSAESRSSTG
jgi:hypothetical protein